MNYSEKVRKREKRERERERWSMKEKRMHKVWKVCANSEAKRICWIWYAKRVRRVGGAKMKCGTIRNFQARSFASSVINYQTFISKIFARLHSLKILLIMLNFIIKLYVIVVIWIYCKLPSVVIIFCFCIISLSVCIQYNYILSYRCSTNIRSL